MSKLKFKINVKYLSCCVLSFLWLRMANMNDLVGFNLDILRYKITILRLFNIVPYISLYFEHRQTHCLCGPPVVVTVDIKRLRRCVDWVFFLSSCVL